MSMKPPSVEYALRQEWSTKEDIVRFNVPRNEDFAHKLVTGNLTTNGVQWSAISCSTAGSSANVLTVGGSTNTLIWPGLDGFYANQVEAGLTMGAIKSTASTGNLKTTVGFRWELKDNTETTWTAISTWKTFPCSSTATYKERTVSGYPTLATGYNKLPLGLRLRAYARTGAARFKIKSSSYVIIKPKKQA